MKLILTLHTTTKWDLVGRIKGWSDIPLNSQGQKEADWLAKQLSSLDITSIISSDLKRASETAKIINSNIGAPLQLNKNLRECSFGKLEGLTKEQIAAQCGKMILSQFDERQYNEYDFKPFGGESRKDVLSRHLEVFNSLSKDDSHDTVLLVGHGLGLCTLLTGLGHTPDLERGNYKIIDL